MIKLAGTCGHPRFRAQVNVNRLTEKEGGPVVAHSADVRVYCAICDHPFVFLATALGVSHTEPTASNDGTELRCPIAPRFPARKTKKKKR